MQHFDDAINGKCLERVPVVSTVEGLPSLSVSHETMLSVLEGKFPSFLIYFLFYYILDDLFVTP